MPSDRQQQDLDIWREWHNTHDPQKLNQLLLRLDPLIQSEVNKWGSAVPRPALEAKARLLAVEALEQYNPNKGAAIGTHVASRLRKLSRSVYPYQNVARIPENQQLYYNTFQVAHNKLEENLGRAPTVPELSDDLGWSARRVTTFQKSFGRRELVESEGSYWKTEEDDGLVDFYYHGLAPRDQKVFGDIVGYKGAKPLSNTELMKKYNMTQGQLSYQKRKFIDDLERVQHGHT
jgi:DNA-directed RNA polymerase specialized sigma subunit